MYHSCLLPAACLAAAAPVGARVLSIRCETTLLNRGREGTELVRRWPREVEAAVLAIL